MRCLAAALVAVGILAADLVADMGYVASTPARIGWDHCATWALVGFVMVVWQERPRR